ncbi:Anion exchange family protein [Rasamsonia emersonii CBS 393.64]|uniref:Anion exchange family protein n=1 Tax=Rasamsonia emersonii (strain ATCC 16479 / CBS 393.64 / IMI 116815) TaxID=1408163 RepID=A0A0F4YP74_RASE3|nr:Anion exchange family protein [Rasamsonia emersonii CBS 393.64]KKA19433.1 Anion exchange family protein [Rasamsonia emersonii CBS 393.64]
MAHLGASHKASSHADFALNPVSSFHSATSSGPSGGPAGPSRKRWQAPRFSSLRASRSNNNHQQQHQQHHNHNNSNSNNNHNNGLHRNEQHHQQEQQEQLSPEQSCTSNATATTARRWWRVRLFRGMINDIKRRAPFYWSDWRDAWDYRVVPATVYMYFANILPALAFSLDMFEKTNHSYGVNEVLLASVLGAVVFSFFAAQPLVIVGVTGPITVFNYTVYDIMAPRGTNYLAFMFWIGLWSLIFHWLLAITNACNGLTYVTRFSCDIFGFYVAFIYLQKGIQVLTRQWGMAGDTSAYLSVMVALLVLMSGYVCGMIGESTLFQRYVRKFIEDYGTPLTIVFFTGFVHYGHMKDVHVETLPTSKAFFPTADRGWLVDLWNISVGEVFLAIPFAILLTILFYFDHNVSSLIAQGTEFPLRKPAGFHWDFFLLGLTTGVAGLLGIPFPNGLIPQAPFHTAALCVTRQVADEDETNKGKTIRVTDHVVEQRVSNLAQGLLTLGTMSGPLLIVLHLIPQGVLAGLFFIMGVQALQGNGITQKLVFLAQDKHLTPPSHPLKRLKRRSAVWAFVILELVGFGGTFAITQTIAAIGFPVIILLLIPVRSFLLPYWFTPEELSTLDAPTASPFTMESVGGTYGVEEEPSYAEPSAGQNERRDDRRGGILESESPSSGPRDRSPTSSESVVEDELERGELYELQPRPSMRRRSTVSK